MQITFKTKAGSIEKISRAAKHLNKLKKQVIFSVFKGVCFLIRLISRMSGSYPGKLLLKPSFSTEIKALSAIFE